MLSYFALKKFKSKLDPRKYNGAIFLGLNGPVVKSHGGTDALGFYYSIDLCYRIIKGNLMDQIKSNLTHLNDQNKILNFTKSDISKQITNKIGVSHRYADKLTEDLSRSY